MMFAKFVKRITGRKVLPNQNQEFEVIRSNFPCKNNSRHNSLPTIEEDDAENDPPYGGPRVRKPANSARTSATSSSFQDDSRSTSSSSRLQKQLPELLAGYKQSSMNVNRLLCAMERLEEVIWSALLMDDLSDTLTIQFNLFDPSIVPPPDVRLPQSILPVEALLKALVMLKDVQNLVRTEERSLADLRSIAAAFAENSKPSTASAKEFVKMIFENTLQPVILIDDQDRQQPHEFVFDEEIKSRLSSIIRFHLRFTLNSMNNFAPVVLAHSVSYYDSSIDNRDGSQHDLNVAALFHNALLLIENGLDEETGVQDALLFRSAKKFAANVLSCIKRIENIDEKRKKAWQCVQRWAGELKRLFPGEMQEFAILYDLKQLQSKLTAQAIANDLALLESHRAALREKRGTAQDLRASRAAMTGLCGRSGFFPEVVFILDA